MHREAPEGPFSIPDLFHAIDGRDAQGFVGFLTTDAEFRFANAPAVNGIHAISDAVQAFFDSIAGVKHTVLEQWENGDTLFCHGLVHYTRHDGSELCVPFANLLHMRDGKVARYLIFTDNSALYSGG